MLRCFSIADDEHPRFDLPEGQHGADMYTFFRPWASMHHRTDDRVRAQIYKPCYSLQNIQRFTETIEVRMNCVGVLAQEFGAGRLGP